MPYRYLEDIATADVALEAWGDTLEELFIAAADATMNVMVSDLNTIHDQVRRTISVESHALDLLLFRFLQEFVFYKDAEQLLLRAQRVVIRQDGERHTAEAQVYGERLDPSKHELVVDVKAVTLHRFQVERTARGWQAQVILDI
ncbi:MAG: archease [Acidobacteriota bacterium]|nr:archease [Blastocatellia bacterium]MDW8240587.1 archease [Acidobacteriota bacterium]